MRLIYRGLVLLLLIALIGSIGVTAEEKSPPQTSARAAILMDQYGQVLYAYNADAPLPMASTTKIMTALVALELSDPQKCVMIPKEAAGIEGSSAYLIAGESMTIETLLYALMLESANDAAVAIAVCLSGSVDSFVEQMNRKAKELGLTQTHFANPHGLDDPEHYTSAFDLARLMIAALKNAQLAQIVATRRYQSIAENSDSTRLFVNHNRLLNEYDGCIGGKTGYTKRTGRCFVSAAQRDSLTLIAVTLNDPNDWKDHRALLDYGFARCEQMTLIPPNGDELSIPMVGGVKKHLMCETQDAISVMLPQDSRPRMVIELPRFVYAGVPKGKQLGKVVWYLNNQPIAAAAIYASETGIVADAPPTLWERIEQFFLGIVEFIIELF